MAEGISAHVSNPCEQCLSEQIAVQLWSSGAPFLVEFEGTTYLYRKEPIYKRVLSNTHKWKVSVFHDFDSTCDEAKKPEGTSSTVPMDGNRQSLPQTNHFDLIRKVLKTEQVEVVKNSWNPWHIQKQVHPPENIASEFELKHTDDEWGQHTLEVQNWELINPDLIPQPRKESSTNPSRLAEEPKTNISQFIHENKLGKQTINLINHMHKNIHQAEDGVKFKYLWVMSYKCPFSGIPLTKENAVQIKLTPSNCVSAEFSGGWVTASRPGIRQFLMKGPMSYPKLAHGYTKYKVKVGHFRQVTNKNYKDENKLHIDFNIPYRHGMISP